VVVSDPCPAMVRSTWTGTQPQAFSHVGLVTSAEQLAAVTPDAAAGGVPGAVAAVPGIGSSGG
jgi:hypothetical protein